METFTDGSKSDEGGPVVVALLCLLVLLTPVAALVEAGTVAWGWVLVGVLVNGLVMGFGPRTRVGRSAGRWFRAIGVAGRLVVIVLAAGLIWNGMAVFEPDPVVGSSYLIGAIPSILVVEALRRR